MAEKIRFEPWRKQHDATKYPFADGATLRGSDGRIILEGCFLDAALYPIGGQARLYLASVQIEHDSVTLLVGDLADTGRASGSFSLISPPDEVALFDRTGRPAGVLVSESLRLAVFQSWGVGTHTFRPEQTEFVASVCIPTPQQGVRSIKLEDGSLFVGDVWLVGADGVVFRSEDGEVRIDVVGDPLFRRRLCVPESLFTTPRFIKTIRLIGSDGSHADLVPDEEGGIKLFVNNQLAVDTVLRLNTTKDGITVGAVGTLSTSGLGLA